ncbi:hypothetical protein ACIRG4_29950 [Streptomyces sp. NPDC102395]|uniref:hypothetical protein n=1 Tax=Streptomyces sp. NPDC102395 TaxID=3366168 RepID=UPI0037FBDBBE
MRRRAALAAAAVLTGGVAVLLGVAAPQAQAAEVSYATRCIPPSGIGLPPVDGTTKVEITAPATAKVGDTVDVVWTFTQAASKNPDIIDLPADSVQPSGTLKAAGAQSADIAMRGPRENPPVPKGGAMALSAMKGSLKLTTAGQVTLTPDAYVVNALSTDTSCAPTQQVQPAATITVTAGSGSSSGGTGEPSHTGTPSHTPTKSTSPSPPASTPTSPSPSGGSGGQTDFTGKVVNVPYTCQSPIGQKKATSPVQINAKRDGESYDLTVQFKKSVMDSPIDIPANSVKPAMQVVLGGADKGSVAVEGPKNAAPIKQGAPIEIPDLTGVYKPGATGEATLSPGVLTIDALGTKTTCTPDSTTVSLTLDTTEQASGASGATGGSGSSSSTAGGASTTGGLAETGAGDHATLKALGLVAGTAVLLGAAVFTYLPGRRRSR